eukprot:NODE_3989_length_1952_cov_1.509041.p2 GENE.NODE_3989_length_1952_cov_1.509041~~NODE_3989_length_1952_cov_1.509041.p2  ORF type:complete len:241 (-),score=50.34 NODE_3989_length_1952_cov_1.509041:500-1222(-)
MALRSAQAEPRMPDLQSQDIANKGWASVTPLAQSLAPMGSGWHAAAPRSGGMQAQNLSNAAWSPRTCRAAGMRTAGVVCYALDAVVPEFDVQGLANALWSLASLLPPHCDVLSRIRDVVVSTVNAAAPPPRDGAYFEAARYQNHLCQLVWSFSFASLLEPTLAVALCGLMLAAGRGLDAVAVKPGRVKIDTGMVEGGEYAGSRKTTKGGEHLACTPLQPEMQSWASMRAASAHMVDVGLL